MLSELKKVISAFRTRRLVLEFDKIPFYYKDVSWKRLINWFLAESTCRLKSPFVFAYPTLFQIEPTNFCNLRCPMCYTTSDTRPRKSMTFEEFKRIIDEIGDYTLLLQLWGWGEPFMNKDFCRMIRYAKNTGMKIITATNGHFFENDHDADELIDSGLDVLMFALDGINAETYEKYRRQGDYEKVVKALKLLTQRKKQRNATLPIINLRMVVTRENENQADQIEKLGEEIGADVLTFKTLWNIDKNKKIETLLPEDPKYRRAQYKQNGEAVRIPNSCRRLWNNPVVYRDGTVVPCYFHNSNHSLGNVFSASRNRGVRRVWFGQRYMNLRFRFIKKQMEDTPCADCVLNFADVERFASHAFWYHPHPESFGNESPFETP
jgi:MoaA/NifB/PqqE/SkfB family radical SAM enzyme